MASTTTARNTGEGDYSDAMQVPGAAVVLLVLVGVLHAVQGAVALVNQGFFVVRTEYLFKFDVTTWGWVHLIGGIILVAAAVALRRGATWARVVAIIFACLSILASFLWLPFYPFGSLAVIAIDLMVIGAVTGQGRGLSY